MPAAGRNIRRGDGRDERDERALLQKPAQDF
jgi:hypothetical protein